MAALDGMYVSLRQVDDAIAQYLPRIGVPPQVVGGAVNDMNALLIGMMANHDYLSELADLPQDVTPKRQEK